ncbi:S8 family peptidase [Halegenticoccus tardaugens]|uniref:S8 family peptidase n=1 Tax=Halegenticoccus tardaugens TaxID=2071624 RepID=UPI00100B0F2B|nr:S8 family peptidase [Halegenticoccus tardaugens]
MLRNSDGSTRRNVLKAVGGTAGLGGITRLASASEGNTVEVIVGFAGKSGRRAAASEAASIHREFAFDAMTISVNENAIPGLRNRGDVRYVEENGTMQAFAQTVPWGVDRVDAPVAHDDGSTGSGADIAIIDTGIDSDHPDLVDNLGEGEAFVECGEGGITCAFSGNDNSCNESWDDDNDHGTHCAGTADAVDNDEGVVGVATEATLHAVKVLDKRGSGTFSDIAAGVEWTADQGYDVASMSLGASSGSEALKDACVYAYDRGVLLVAAAGNDGPCSDCVGYPAAYDEVVAVSATSEDDSLADFSSTGPEIELAAPGEDVYSTIPGGYDTFSGTSMACPHVAGAGALLMAEGDTNAEARDRLRGTAEDVGLSSEEQGDGLLDAAAAVGL